MGDEAFHFKLLEAVCGPTGGVGSGHTLPMTQVHHCQPCRKDEAEGTQLLTQDSGSRHQRGQVCGCRLPAAALTASLPAPQASLTPRGPAKR